MVSHLVAEAAIPDDWIEISLSVDNSSAPKAREGHQIDRDGDTNSSGFGKQIAFGMIANPGQFPSMASLSLPGDYWTHVCGAVLVSGIGFTYFFYSVKYAG